MDKKLTLSSNPSISKLDFLLLGMSYISFMLLLSQSQYLPWMLMIGTIVCAILYKYPEFLVALSVQAYGAYNFLLEQMNYSTVKRLIFLFGAICLLLLILKGLRKEKLLIIKEPIIFLTIVFTLLWVISLSDTLSPRYGNQKVGHHILFNLPLFFQFIVFRWDLKSYRNLFVSAFGWTILLLFNSIFFLSQYGINLKSDLNYFNINPIWMGRVYGVGIIICSYLWFSSKGLLKKGSLIIGLCFLVMFLIINKRGPILALAIVLVVLLYFRKKELLKANYYTTFGLFFLGLLGYLFRQDIFAYISSLGSSSHDLSGFFRIYMFKLFTKVINLIDWIGVGAGSFSKISTGQDLRWYPHNIIIETFLEAGIIAGVILILMLLIQFIEFLKLRKMFFDNKEALNLILHTYAIFLFGLLNAQFSGDLFTNRYLWIGLGLHVGLSLYLKTTFNSRNRIK